MYDRDDFAFNSIPTIGRFAKSSAIPNSYFLNKSFYQETLPNNADIFLRNKLTSPDIKIPTTDPIVYALISGGFILSASLIPKIAARVAELRNRGLSRDIILKVVKDDLQNQMQ